MANHIFTLRETADETRFRILKNGEPYKWYGNREDAKNELDRLNTKGE